jgi:hypothetical protein
MMSDEREEVRQSEQVIACAMGGAVNIQERESVQMCACAEDDIPEERELGRVHKKSA